MNLKIDKDIWQYLTESRKNIVMYGMGNGADKILSVCEKKGIEVLDFFASDGFVRGHSFHGKRVLSYSEAKEKYGADNMIVLMSFASSLPEVIDNVMRISEECELYAPDVPVFGDTLFDMEFFLEHKSEIEEVWQSLADDRSREVLESVLNYKLSGSPRYLESVVDKREEVYRDILCADKISSALDLGAYNGDTVRELAEYSESLREVTALEPDARNFKKLSAYAEGETRFRVNCVNAAAWDRTGVLEFSSDGNRNSNVGGGKKRVSVEAISTDSLDIESLDYIKYDVEGSEKEALLGSRRTIEKYSPALLVSLYHRSEDIFVLPKLVRELGADYSFYLRRYRYIPAWDLNLLCVKTK